MRKILFWCFLVLIVFAGIALALELFLQMAGFAEHRLVFSIEPKAGGIVKRPVWRFELRPHAGRHQQAKCQDDERGEPRVSRHGL